MASSAEVSLLKELAALYQETDALYATWSCPTSTECCRFGVTGREPFVTSLELTAIERAVAARGGPLAKLRRALPLVRDSDDGSDQRDARSERICPLLAVGGRCSIYADRPLGCRTFFCDRAAAGDEIPRATLKQIRDRLRDLAARHRDGGDQPRPLGRVLGV